MPAAEDVQKTQPAPSMKAPPPASRAARAAGPAASNDEQGPDVWHAVRVSVKTSVRDPTLLIVRRLPPSTPAPSGTREALIVLMDSSAELFGGDEHAESH
jgi:hypothetical protein